MNQILLSFICIFAFSMGSNIEEIEPNAKILLVIFPVILICLQSDNIFRRDFESGALDFQIISYEKYQIYLSKIIPLLVSSALVVFFNIFLGHFSLKLDIEVSKQIFVASIPLLVSSNLIVLIVGAADIYLEEKGNFASFIALPFILPNLILYGLFFHLNSPSLIYIGLGINLIFLPISFLLVRHLLEELYNN